MAFIPDQQGFTPDNSGGFSPDSGGGFTPDEFSAEEAAKQFLIGFGNSALFSVPELLAGEKFDALASDNQGERIARGVGTALGFTVGAPAKVFGAGSKLALRGIGKSGTVISRLANVSSKAKALPKTLKGTKLLNEINKARIAKGAIEGAGGGALFNAVDPSVPIQDKPEKILEGIAGGAILGGALGAIPKRVKVTKKGKAVISEATSKPTPYGADGRRVVQDSALQPSTQKFIPRAIQKEFDKLQGFADDSLAAKRDIIPYAQQRKLAKPILDSIDQTTFDNLKPGDVANTENIRALMQHVLRDISASVRKNGVIVNQSKFDQAVSNIKKVQAIKSELGRALGSTADDQLVEGEVVDVINAFLQNTTSSNKEALGNFVKNIAEPTFWDKFIEYRTAALLTSPFTHLRNIIGNSIGRLYRVPEKALAGGVDAVRSAVTGQPRTRFASEAIADMVGMKMGFRQALRNSYRALVDENYKSADRVLEEVRLRQAVGGKTGQLVRAPFRALSAMDEFFSTLAHKASLYSNATRIAAKEGGDVAARTAALIKSRRELMTKASQEALVDTFRQKLGPTGQELQAILNKSKIGKFVIPFFRTPVNLFKWSFDRGPTSILSTGNWKAISSGTAEQKAEAWARVAIGQMTGAMLMFEAIDGNITGRLSGNYDRVRSLQRQGIQPYSIRMGKDKDGRDRWISYRSYEPISSMLALVANTAEIIKEKDEPLTSETASEIVWESIKMLKDQSFLKGISDLTNALDDPERFADRFIQNAATSLVPTGLGYASRLADPTLREIESIPDAIRNKIPFLSKGLQPRLDVWGRPITKEGSLAQRALLPSGVMTEKPDLTESELLSLEKFPRKINKAYRGLKLSASDRNQITRVEGQITKAMLDKLTSSPVYKTFTPDQQLDAINSIFLKVRKDVRKQMTRPVFLKQFKESKTQSDRLALFEKFFNVRITRE